MSLTLKVESGPLSSKVVHLSPGQAVRVGREQPSDLIVRDDGVMSRVHFEIGFDGQSIWLSDLGSTNGTYVNASRVSRAEVREGDEIKAGRTTFRVVNSTDSPAETSNTNQVKSPPGFTRLLAAMKGELQPLYVVLDTARDPEIFKLLSHHGQPYYWLFEGEASAKLAHFAPYLVPLGADSPLLDVLLHEGWGKKWGIYMSSIAALPDLLWFLRRSLTAKLFDGTSSLLRYYDPGIFRMLALSSRANQMNFLFSKVAHYLVEGEDAEIALIFSMSPGGLRTINMPLSGESEATMALTQPTHDPAGSDFAGNMLILREEQIELFAAKKGDGLGESLLKDLRKFYPADVAVTGDARVEAMIQHACERAPRYGIRDQADLRTYITMMMRFGMCFDVDPSFPWAAQVLAMRLKPGCKMEKLVAAANKAPRQSENESTRLIPRV